MRTTEVDYLVVGAGAMGMAFADTIVAETDAHIAVVDRGHQPGGHWTHAYPFVRLHQPSAYYGVNSHKLGSDTIDVAGWNEGLFELATGGEVCAYFDHVMSQRLMPTGRVAYFPMSEYLGGGRVRTLTGEEHAIEVSRRIVDATYLQTVVPSMRRPDYEVADGVDCVPPNELPTAAPGHDRFVVVGAGKTGIDVCLWLLRNGLGPDRLTWIAPRDAWLLDRATVQPGGAFREVFKANFVARLDSIAAAISVDDLFTQLESRGVLLRIDSEVTPTMYRCATVARAELDQLLRVSDIVRKGRVQRITPHSITLGDGQVRVSGPTLFIDCTADGLERRSARTVFDQGQITLQSVRGCQQVFSAAMTAHVEAAYPDDHTKNELCVPVPHPDSHLDWLSMTLIEQRNEIRWIEHPELLDWLVDSRLNLMRDIYIPLVERQRIRERLLGMVTSSLRDANAKLESLLGPGAPAISQSGGACSNGSREVR